MLALSVATMMLALAMPGMAMPVLFKEISVDLRLDLVQIGSLWGFGALTGAIFGMFGGMAGDLRNARWVIGVSCMLAGVVGASRGFSNGYAALAATTLLMGVVGSAVSMNIHKIASQWFSAHSYGKANSVLACGVGVGTTLGSLLSASFLSPWLGGWRHVTFFYGGVSFVLGVLWFVSPDAPAARPGMDRERILKDFREAFRGVLALRAFWIVSLVGLFYGAAGQGFVGYLPLYLTRHNWTPLAADGALSAYNAASIVGVIPLVILAEKLGLRRALLLVGSCVMAAGLLFVSVYRGALVWPVVAIMGLFREAFVAVTITYTVQIAGIGPRYAGTALGFSFAVAGIARFASPPLGNSLAEFGTGYPFLLWAALAVASSLALFFMRAEKGVTAREVVKEMTEVPW
jgi:CP family cyanate transporter-like MFS transporter